MILKIDYNIYRLAYGGTGVGDIDNKAQNNWIHHHIFDPDSYLIFDKDSYDADFVENPIEFPKVTRIEAQRAYIKKLDNRRLNHKFKALDDKEFWDLFWNYFDDGAGKLIDFETFEEKYQLQKIIDWCDENNIVYYLDKKDEFIEFLGG